MLYSIAIEPLLQQIRCNVAGLSLPNSENNFCLSAYADDVVVVISGQNDVNKLTNLIEDFSFLSSARINWSKCETLLVGKWTEGKPILPSGLIWGKKGLKYLGVFLGDDETQQKNWDGVLDKTKACLDKWRWLIPNMSYRGRILVANNLVASSLWHRLACVDPPKHLLAKVQALLVDFFWDKLHWVQQSVLYLPKEEGGQGLVHLQSRTAAFRLQFVQKLLAGASNCNWKIVACAILQSYGGFGLDKHLFLLNPLKGDFNKMSSFYRNLLNLWSMFCTKKAGVSTSLYWLLEEPLILGVRLDVLDSCNLQGFRFALQRSRIITLGQLLTLAGPNLDNAEVTSHHLGSRSVRLVSVFLCNLKAVLTGGEIQMLQDYVSGVTIPNVQDFFPCLMLLPKLDDCTGFYFKIWESLWLDLSSTNSKALYRACVMVFNQKNFVNKTDTPWRVFVQAAFI